VLPHRRKSILDEPTVRFFFVRGNLDGPSVGHRNGDGLAQESPTRGGQWRKLWIDCRDNQANAFDLADLQQLFNKLGAVAAWYSIAFIHEMRGGRAVRIYVSADHATGDAHFIERFPKALNEL
jgi:hypothetical protein